MAIERVAAWSIAIFAARESIATLEQTIIAAMAAAAEETIIDVLVNGNQALANQAALLPCIRENGAASSIAKVRIWFIPLGDKAHAWNQYVHVIWPETLLTFFVDGYVRVRRDALMLLERGLKESPAHLAATGVPSVGRSATRLREDMLSNGGIHGNLFALKSSTMRAIRDADFKLPIGLYRTDSTIGAALSFQFDPSCHAWNPKGTILVHPEATWATDEKRLLRYSDVTGQLKRILRQGQGILENLAVRNHFAMQKKLPKDLPGTATELVERWRHDYPQEARSAFLKHPLLVSLALKKLRKPGNWKHATDAPELKYPR